MAPAPRRANRHTPRCAAWDYRTPGPYFVTMNTKGRLRVFSCIRGGEVLLTSLGEVVAACWQSLALNVPGVQLGRFVVMPDHLHGIVILPRASLSLIDLIGQFKAAVSREAPGMGVNPPRPLWQRSFHDRFIRSPREWWRIDRYIARNPERWVE